MKSLYNRAFFRDLLLAARANFIPVMGLQCVAAILLWSYYYWPAAHVALDEVGEWKLSTGYWFAFVTSLFGGGLLPYLLQGMQRGDHRRIALASLPFVSLSWGLRGCLVDAFYQFQSVLWGNKIDPVTIVVKILFDLGVFSPFLAVPTIVLVFAVVDSNFNFQKFRSTFHGGVLRWWLREVWPLQRIGWMVWLPALGAIYALPTGLQFPTQVIIQCLWSLILVVATGQNSSSPEENSSAAA